MELEKLVFGRKYRIINTSIIKILVGVKKISNGTYVAILGDDELPIDIRNIEECSKRSVYPTKDINKPKQLLNTKFNILDTVKNVTAGVNGVIMAIGIRAIGSIQHVVLTNGTDDVGCIEYYTFDECWL